MPRLLLTAALLLVACGTDCPEGQTEVGGRCVPEVDVSLTAGETATGGEGMTGGSTGGTTTGGTTTGGTGGGTGGTVTGGNEMMPCDGACGGDTPLCLATNDSDAGMDMCVACIDETQCDAGSEKDLCDPLTHACVECIGDGDCSGTTDLCLAGTCVTCKSDADCTTADAARCDPTDHTCKGCDDSTQCKDVDDGSGNALPVCNTNAMTCVQCTSSSHCNTPAAPTCNSSNNTCVGCGATGNPDPDGDCVGIVDTASGVPLEACDEQSATCIE